MAEQTIAIIGIQETSCPVFVEKLASTNVRLLVIPNSKDHLNKLNEKFQKEQVTAEVEVQNCAKDGCWEADVIALLDPERYEGDLVNRIREVSVQKIVMLVSVRRDSCTREKIDELVNLLPHSRIVQVATDPETAKALVTGKDQEAVQIISSLLQKAAFTVSVQA